MLNIGVEAADVQDLAHLLVDAAKRETLTGCPGFLYKHQKRPQPRAGDEIDVG